MNTYQRDFFQQRQETNNDRAELRRNIRSVLLSTRQQMSVEQITQALYNQDGAVIKRELHTLAHSPKSDICHNGRRGLGSRYEIGTLLTRKE